MKKILIVEDNKHLQFTLSTLLQESGYIAYVAGNKLKAIIDFNLKKPDLILLDKKLPDGDGMDLIKEFKGLNQKLPIIMLTAYAEPKFKDQAISLGANAFITKPFDIIELVTIIENLLKIYNKNKNS